MEQLFFNKEMVKRHKDFVSSFKESLAIEESELEIDEQNLYIYLFNEEGRYAEAPVEYDNLDELKADYEQLKNLLNYETNNLR